MVNAPRKKPYRIFEDDHLWLKYRAAETGSTMIGVLSKSCKAHDLLHTYFESNYGFLSERNEGEFERTGKNSKSKVYPVGAPLYLWLDQFMHDETILMGSNMSKPRLMNMLISQYRYYLKNKEVVLSWFKQQGVVPGG